MSKITHEQIKEIFYRIYYHIENIPRKELIDRYFLQQEKQEKLLELYRKLLKLEQDDFYELYKGNSEEYFKEWKKTFEQIKELENE